MYGGTKRSCNVFVVRIYGRTDTGEGRDRYLIPDEPLAALNGENRAEDAHWGTSATVTSRSCVRNGDGLGRRIRGILGALLALVELLWIAAFVWRVCRSFRGLVLVRLDIHEPRGLGIVGCGG